MQESTHSLMGLFRIKMLKPRNPNILDDFMPIRWNSEAWRMEQLGLLHLIHYSTIQAILNISWTSIEGRGRKKRISFFSYITQLKWNHFWSLLFILYNNIHIFSCQRCGIPFVSHWTSPLPFSPFWMFLKTCPFD